MPVRATTTVDIREEIALMALSGAYTISELAELFEITRPTIYKYRERYRAGGRSGLVDQRRAPRHPRRTPEALVQRIVAERRRWGWGSKKIRRRLLDAEPERAWPARSTIDEIFKRHQLVVPRRRPLRVRSPFRHSCTATEPGELTTIDFKGEFRLGNRRVPDARRWQALAADDERAAAEKSVRDGASRRDVRRFARSGRSLLRYAKREVVRL